MKKYKNYIAGKWVEGSGSAIALAEVFSGKSWASASFAGMEQLETALNAASGIRLEFLKTSREMRASLLTLMLNEMRARKHAFVEAMIAEAGKPLSLAEAEFSRAEQTFQIAIEECTRFFGEKPIGEWSQIVAKEGEPSTYWTPKGVVLAITPFNFPLNLVVHKLAPALAVGAPILLKPTPRAPGCSVLLVECFEAACSRIKGVPVQAAQLVLAENNDIKALITDPRVAVLSFTGSGEVGWKLSADAALAGGKRVLLELGGNAAVIVHSDAELDRAANRIATGAFSYAGQSCISVQRIFIHDSVYEKMLLKLITETQALKLGDPRQKDTIVGPVIDSSAIARLQDWIKEAVTRGAKILLGGKVHNGNVMEPTLLESVPAGAKLNVEEAFGPVAILSRYSTIEDAFAKVNDSKFGLQAGIFTSDRTLAEEAVLNLDVGGILVNEIPTYRADAASYGGTKLSGIGREGPKFAMQEYCEPKAVYFFKSESGSKR